MCLEETETASETWDRGGGASVGHLGDVHMGPH